MTHRFVPITGLLLAGGASRRMGRDKTKLILGEETLVARQVRSLLAVCRAVVVVGSRENFPQPQVRAVADVLPGCGPLGGIYTGLLQARTEYNLILGCDLPFISKRFLQFLCECALEGKADVTVAQSPDRRLQPLCGVYRRQAASAIRSRLEAGEYKTSAFFGRVHCRVLSWPEVARRGFAPSLFANLNTPEDYEAAKIRC